LFDIGPAAEADLGDNKGERSLLDEKCQRLKGPIVQKPLRFEYVIHPFWLERSCEAGWSYQFYGQNQQADHLSLVCLRVV
jgi:hypothetical protein